MSCSSCLRDGHSDINSNEILHINILWHVETGACIIQGLTHKNPQNIDDCYAYINHITSHWS